MAGLAGAVGAEQRNHFTGCYLQSEIQREAAAANPELGGQLCYHRLTHRSRSSTSTATETPSKSTEQQRGPGIGFQRGPCAGTVRVVPGKFPAKVIVAPNSPRARAQASTAPAAMPGRMRGKVIRRKTPPAAPQGCGSILVAAVGCAQRTLHRQHEEGQRDEDLSKDHGVRGERKRKAGELVQRP